MGKGKGTTTGEIDVEANPYAAPQATLEEIRAYDLYDLENRKASRGKRLGAVLLDGLVNVVCAIPIILGVTMAGGVQGGTKPAGPRLASGASRGVRRRL